MELLLLLIALLIGIAIHYARVSSHKSSIEMYIVALNGKYVDHERAYFLTGIGPFKIVGKGRMIYKFTYELNGQVKIGWVRFGSIMGPNWQLDYEDYS